MALARRLLLVPAIMKRTLAIVVLASFGLFTPAEAGKRRPNPKRKPVVAEVTADRPTAPAAKRRRGEADDSTASRAKERDVSETYDVFAPGAKKRDLGETYDVFAPGAKKRDLGETYDVFAPGAKKRDLGETYDVFARGGRSSRLPSANIDTDEIEIELRPLTQAQIAKVIRERRGELEYCWSRLSARQRDASCTAILELTVEPEGKVSSVRVTGDAPPVAATCITSAASRWTFDESETESEVSYPISLRSL